MSNGNRDSDPSQVERGNLAHIITDWIVSILLSFGTAFSISTVTAKLFDYYMAERFKQGLDAGAGVVFIYLFALPLLFVIALLIWRLCSGEPRNLISSFKKWIIALLMSLGVGYLMVAVMTNNWRTESYASFVRNQELTALGFPFFSLGTYTIVLLVLRR